jgi:hypothetical protein
MTKEIERYDIIVLLSTAKSVYIDQQFTHALINYIMMYSAKIAWLKNLALLPADSVTSLYDRSVKELVESVFLWEDQPLCW